jgi:3-phosphoshikimate 1-carboxyvinyltransferase
MKNVISAPLKPVRDTIHIPSSKSISNRMLIIHALSVSMASLLNLSESDDTIVLRKALDSKKDVKDVGHAGTAMRFLTAYLSTQAGEVILTGSERMKERPIGPLVDALKQLGAQIIYLEKNGCPPIRIRGGSMTGGSISIEAGISSQFISALMMIGPVLEGGLSLDLEGDIVSATYINMTLALMNACGAAASFEGNRISIPQGAYNLEDFRVESDWSSASYWFQVAALIPGSEITLSNLERNSLQGDSALTEIFKGLGVQSDFKGNDLTLSSRVVKHPAYFEYDFSGCPDLVQTLAVTLCSLGIPFHFTGTITLRIKETDRLAALQKELKRVGKVLRADTRGEWLEWDGTRCEPERHPYIRTYHDHRMAMAFAPLAIPLGRIIVKDPGVVSKSYPSYWSDLEKAGFAVANS